MSEYFNPAPVVVGLVFPEPEKIVIVQRAIEPFVGHYALPGGYVEREPWRDALKREIDEEAHIEVSANPEHMESFGFESTPDGTKILLFAIIKPAGVLKVRKFTPTKETSKRRMASISYWQQPKLCFPLHSDALTRYTDEHFSEETQSY